LCATKLKMWWGIFCRNSCERSTCSTAAAVATWYISTNVVQWLQSRFAETLTLTLNPNFGLSASREDTANVEFVHLQLVVVYRRADSFIFHTRNWAACVLPIYRSSSTSDDPPASCTSPIMILTLPLTSAELSPAKWWTSKTVIHHWWAARWKIVVCTRHVYYIAVAFDCHVIYYDLRRQYGINLCMLQGVTIWRPISVRLGFCEYFY